MTWWNEARWNSDPLIEAIGEIGVEALEEFGYQRYPVGLELQEENEILID